MPPGATKKSLPIVLVSSRAFVFDIEKQLRAGIDRSLVKPVALHDLTKICDELTEDKPERAGGEQVATGGKVLRPQDVVH